MSIIKFRSKNIKLTNVLIYISKYKVFDNTHLHKFEGEILASKKKIKKQIYKKFQYILLNY